MVYSPAPRPGPDGSDVRPTKDEPGSASDFVVFRVRRALLYGVAGVLVGFVGGFVIARATVGLPEVTIQGSLDGQTTPATGPQQQAGPVEIDIDGRPARGPEDAPVTIVEFTDYQCPFCARHFNDALPTILEDFGDEVRYVVLNFPLTNIHRQAQKAAEAAECANEQGKFWDYHDILFANQEALEVDSLKEYAAMVGLDQASFDGCLESGDTAGIVESDLEEGQSAGVTGTPTFFVNGMRHTGATTAAAWVERIEQAKEASSL